MTETLRKLNYKAQDPALVLDPPASFSAELAALKASCAVHGSAAPGSAYAFVMAFCPMKADALAAEGLIKPAAAPDAVVWFAFPKQGSKAMKSDLNRDRLWEALAPLGWQPKRKVSIDDDWSALRFKHSG